MLGEHEAASLTRISLTRKRSAKRANGERNCRGTTRKNTRGKRRGMSKILGRNLVAQVENSSRGIDAQDDTFHSRHIGGFFAKIGGESDNGLRHGLMLATAGTGLMEF